MFPETRWTGGRTFPSSSDAKVESVAAPIHRDRSEFPLRGTFQNKIQPCFSEKEHFSLFPLADVTVRQSQSIKEDKIETYYFKPMKNILAIHGR